MTGKAKQIGPQQPSAPRMTSIGYGLNNDIGAGIGPHESYFNGYIGSQCILLWKNITNSFTDTDNVTPQHKTTATQAPCAGLACIVQNNKIEVARAGNEHRAILVYKHNDVYQRKVISDVSNENIGTFSNPSLSTYSLTDIEANNAFIIIASCNFYGDEYYAAPVSQIKSHFDEEILAYFNKEKNNQDTVVTIAQMLQEKAITRNNKINKGEKPTENLNSVVCVSRVKNGIISGVTSGNQAKKLHEQLMLQSAIVEMQKIITSKITHDEKIAAVYQFRETHIKLPWWREHYYIIGFVTCIALGILLGGLCSGPLVLPVVLLAKSNAALIEGTLLGISVASATAGLHYGYRRYHISSKTPEQLQQAAIADAKLYPSPSL